jgi:hypothetical protein
MSRKKRPGKGIAFPELPIDLTTQLVSRLQDLLPSVKADYLKQEIMSKYVSHETDPPEVRRNAAIRKWLATERENEATNDRLLITPEEYNILPRVAYSDFVSWCRDFISGIIGDTPPIEATLGSFSGGASTSRPRTLSHPSSKYLGTLHSTASCSDYFFSVIAEEMPGWISSTSPLSVEIVSGNMMFTVPKKTDIDRVACKEPDLNMFVQKGIGSYFRNCLRRHRINLNDQSINRSLAREGSITGKLATLDLSSASDSVSTGLVALLLPVTWCTLLEAVRSPVTVIDGEEHQNHMFSSMGNGFTFELESLLFYTLTKACCYFRGARGVVSIYGDDIICPTDIVAELTFVLGYFGFSVNTEKSFSSGPFRESCGGHYYNGYDITPFYIRKPIETIDELIDVANKLREWAGGISTVLDPEIEPIWLWLKSFVPSVLWGGEDTSFKYQLVSRDTPHSRLTEIRKKKGTGLGGYFHWLNATWRRERSSDGLQTSSKVKSTNKLELKRCRRKTVPLLDHLWLSELSDLLGNSEV